MKNLNSSQRSYLKGQAHNLEPMVQIGKNGLTDGVIHSLNDEQDIRKMGGLRFAMPLTFYTFLIGALALSSFPLTSGFFSKEEIKKGKENYYEDNEFSTFELNLLESKVYDGLQALYKTNDKKYIIYSISGAVDCKNDFTVCKKAWEKNGLWRNTSIRCS